MILKPDCRHFPGDRPCSFNKSEGVMCDSCPHYEVASIRILIIKLDAVGDVLRTTAILHGLTERYRGSEISWVTRQSALPLFENNTLVHRVLAYESTEAVLHCSEESFDLAINLDAARESAVLASHVKAKEKLGFGLDARGHVVPFNEEAIGWLEMGAFDQKKKQNTRSYQDLMLEICRLKPSTKDIVLVLSDREMEFARAFTRNRALNRNVPCVGMNTGASPRWQYKQWSLEGFEELLSTVLKETNWTVLLYGGPYEAERNRKLASIDPTRIIDTGSQNSLREFFALITPSDVFFTGDTLALHAATALGKKVVAYFGPTSATEIDSYNGQVVKIQSDLECLVCYKPRCDFNPNCMNSLTSEHMFTALQSAVRSLPKS
jgi:ADP-heptose:LPS heptosyltransferase